jgi:cell division protein FtsZ
MSIDFIRPEVDELRPRISVIGVGGAGGNAIANMMRADVQGVDFVVANTDAQALNASLADHRIQLGLKITQGLGAGSRPEIGRAAAEETIDEIVRSLEGAHMCFIAAGMGGGTGTGAAPVIASLAAELGALTVAVVTKPFKFEGKKRQLQAERGLEALRDAVDTIITIPNERLLSIIDRSTPLTDAFCTADDVLRQAIQGISDLILVPGLINLDFADVKTIMSGMGLAMMGTGVGEGESRAIDAARKAISSPLLEGASVNGARGVIINVTGGPDLSLIEVSDASTIVQEAADEDANIIFGAVVDPNLKGRVKITVIATGFDPTAAVRPSASAAQTPVDMTPYTEQPRLRAEPPAASMAVDRMSAPRLSIARRPILDLPTAASLSAGSPAMGDRSPAAEMHPDAEMSATFDVPAFLRRQES